MTIRAMSRFTAAALMAACAMVTVFGQPAETTAQASTIDRLAVDVVTDGNAATTLGPLDACRRVEVGADFTVDVVVDAVPEGRPLVAFELKIGYDPALLEVTAMDGGYLLGAVGVYEPFVGFQDSFPDTDGSAQISMLDLASNSPAGANMESGPGILARLTLRAKAVGQSTLVPSHVGTAEDYPVLIDGNGEIIPIDHLAGGFIAVGQDCPAGSTPIATALPTPIEFGTPVPDSTTPGGETGSAETPPPNEGTATDAPSSSSSPSPSRTPTLAASPTSSGTGSTSSGDDGDSNTAALLVAAALAGVGLLAAGAGGWILFRRRQQEAGNPMNPESGFAGSPEESAPEN